MKRTVIDHASDRPICALWLGLATRPKAMKPPCVMRSRFTLKAPAWPASEPIPPLKSDVVTADSPAGWRG